MILPISPAPARFRGLEKRPHSPKERGEDTCVYEKNPPENSEGFFKRLKGLNSPKEAAVSSD